jgi:RNA polymerase sigma-70 factor, ECF subfamily
MDITSRDLEAAAPVSQRNTHTQQDRVEAFYQYRELLFSILLVSAADAEDMLQETFIRWQQCSQSEIQSPRAFLVTIVSRLCIQQRVLFRLEKSY